jgi:hypothetical protein
MARGNDDASAKAAVPAMESDRRMDICIIPEKLCRHCRKSAALTGM